MAKVKTGHVVLRLTPRQAQVLWDIVDGAADAGACDDGLTPMEQRSLEAISSKLLPFMLSRAKARRA